MDPIIFTYVTPGALDRKGFVELQDLLTAEDRVHATLSEMEINLRMSLATRAYHRFNYRTPKTLQKMETILMGIRTNALRKN